MKTSGTREGRPVLYAMRASLYSSKARSFMLKQGIDFIEIPPGDPSYVEQVVPAIGRWIIPVLETVDGSLIQDTEDIIAHLDERLPEDRSAFPRDPVLAVLGAVLSWAGSEGLMRAALHYRWNFDEENLPFVLEDFGRGLMLPGSNSFASTGFDVGDDLGDKGLEKARSQVAEFAGGRMRDLTVAFGVNAETIPTLEESYMDFLARLSTHLEQFPYLLGGRPTIADYAFMAPLYAHLSRDPHPSALMKRHAWPVWSWVERMLVPIEGTGQYGKLTTELFADDAIPESLNRVLAWFGDENSTELAAHVRAIDAHLAEHEPAEGDVVGGKPSRRALEETTFDWRGHTITTRAIPYRLTHIQRIQGLHSALAPGEQAIVREILADAGLGLLLDAKARRRVERRDNVEVWSAGQEPELPVVD